MPSSESTGITRDKTKILLKSIKITLQTNSIFIRANVRYKTNLYRKMELMSYP